MARIGLSEVQYNSGSNRACNFKSAEHVYVAQGRFEITSPARTHELYDTKAYYQQLIVSITKCENLSLGIFINVRETSKAKTWTWNVEARPHDDL